MKQKEIYKLALEKWGSNFQLMMLIEELSELMKCLAKTHRNQTVDIEKIAEETADVEIMLAQLRVIEFNKGNIFQYPSFEKRVQRWKRIKKYRLIKLIKQDQKETGFIESRTIE